MSGSAASWCADDTKAHVESASSQAAAGLDPHDCSHRRLTGKKAEGSGRPAESALYLNLCLFSTSAVNPDKDRSGPRGFLICDLAVSEVERALSDLGGYPSVEFPRADFAFISRKGERNRATPQADAILACFGKLVIGPGRTRLARYRLSGHGTAPEKRGVLRFRDIAIPRPVFLEAFVWQRAALA